MLSFSMAGSESSGGEATAPVDSSAAAQVEPTEEAQADSGSNEEAQADSGRNEEAQADSGEAAAPQPPADPQLAADRESTSAEVSDDELEREVAALLFASPEPLSESKLAGLLDGTPAARVRLALDGLARRLAASGLPWELRSIAGGWQLYTSEALADTVGRLAKVRKDEKVSPAGLETLAIVAYRQPVTKGEIEAIRGVQVGPILRTLVDRGLVKVAGRSDDPGRPLLYGTTKKFLDSFGLGSLDDLPRDGELLRD